jgi:hypothetical protein
MAKDDRDDDDTERRRSGPATKDAEEKTRAFLALHLAGASSAAPVA